MSLALAKKQSPDNKRKQKRESTHDISASSSNIYTNLQIPVIQRKTNCPCGGGCPRCKDNHIIQAKLKINKSGDVYEQEADSVAEQVMRMPENTGTRGQLLKVRKEAESVQRKPT